jgi:O-antigen/teichoic acid export membrane protein
MVSLFIPIFNLSDMAAAATRGFKSMKYTVIAQNVAQPMIRLVLILALAILFGLNAQRALLAAGATELIVAVLLLYFLNKLFRLRRRLWEGRREVGRLLKFTFPVYLSNLVIRFGGNIKSILLAMFGAISNVGVFAIVSQVTLLGDMFHQSIGLVAQPIISELYSRNDMKELGRVYQTMTRWTVTINLPLFLILILFPLPILSIFGKSFIAGAAALSVMAWTGFVDIATGICGIMLDMTDKTRLKLFNTVFAYVISIGLSIALIPPLGVMGAALSTLASATLINLLRVAEVFVLYRVLPYNVQFLKPLAAGLAAVGAAIVVAGWLPPGSGDALNAIFLIIDCAILAAVYVGTLLLLGLSKEDRAILERLRRRVLNRFPEK